MCVADGLNQVQRDATGTEALAEPGRRDVDLRTTGNTKWPAGTDKG